MTKRNLSEYDFLNLLTDQWPQTRLLVSHLGISDALKALAGDAFINKTEGAASDALRDKLKDMQQHGSLIFPLNST